MEYEVVVGGGRRMCDTRSGCLNVNAVDSCCRRRHFRLKSNISLLWRRHNDFEPRRSRNRMPYPVSIFNSLSAFKFAAKKQQLVLLLPPRPEAPQRDTRMGGCLDKRFCYVFSESSMVILLLPCCLCKHKELSEKCLHNLLSK